MEAAYDLETLERLIKEKTDLLQHDINEVNRLIELRHLKIVDLTKRIDKANEKIECLHKQVITNEKHKSVNNKETRRKTLCAIADDLKIPTHQRFFLKTLYSYVDTMTKDKLAMRVYETWRACFPQESLTSV